LDEDCLLRRRYLQRSQRALAMVVRLDHVKRLLYLKQVTARIVSLKKKFFKKCIRKFVQEKEKNFFNWRFL